MIVGDVGGEELAAAVSRFREAVSEWGLSAAELAALLGIEVAEPNVDPLAGALGVDAETRLRLATDVAHLMERLWEPAMLRSWLRDDEDDDPTPLDFISKGATELRSMRAALAARLS